jgi:hypothetical protein
VSSMAAGRIHARRAPVRSSRALHRASGTQARVCRHVQRTTSREDRPCRAQVRFTARPGRPTPRGDSLVRRAIRIPRPRPRHGPTGTPPPAARTSSRTAPPSPRAHRASPAR